MCLFKNCNYRAVGTWWVMSSILRQLLSLSQNIYFLVSILDWVSLVIFFFFNYILLKNKIMVWPWSPGWPSSMLTTTLPLWSITYTRSQNNEPRKFSQWFSSHFLRLYWVRERRQGEKGVGEIYHILIYTLHHICRYMCAYQEMGKY